MADAVPFPTLRPLILEEWPGLDAGALDATEGDEDRLLTLITELTGGARTRARRQLDDLKALAAKDRAAQAADRLETLLRRLEGQAQDLRGRVQNDLVPEAEKKVKENLLMSLAIALGFGLLLGLLLGSSGRGR